MSEETVRAYYDAIDAKDFETFADCFAPDVVHERPDRTIEGRETLVGFMRDDRPQKDTSHEVRRVFAGAGSSGAGGTDGDEIDGDGGAVAVEGRLLDSGGEPLFSFADVFDLEDGRIVRIRTYTH
ncbi:MULTISPECIES: nuclear transport factor 2 family protein [Halorussus]|uniref:nuclear transport factor 2 family protein n=1 Tax=Halorussus TaxID=1070314 RepID=UPI0020A1A875|nr:nuclear transport factor 2 family protein [Halorussus vallis]USZ77600.1 nuclear transport factor 2 family protein [Halorussus vallis]